jgi:polyhydroxyalkanoate synthase
VRWAVGEGMTVFVISWVNPDERLAHKDFEDYLLEGPLAGARRDRAGDRRSGRERRSAIASAVRCSAATLAYLAAQKKQKRIASATFMTALIDFTEAGELEVFIDEDQVPRSRRRCGSAAISKAARWATRSTCCARTT